MCQGLFGGKIAEIGMIQKDLSQVEITLEVMVEVMECMDNSQ